MKKITLIFMILISTISYSQIIDDYGLKIGGTLSHQNWNYASFLNGITPDNRMNINIGLFVESSNISFFNFIGEVNFVKKGVENEFNVKTFEHPEGKTKLWQLGINYLNLTILAKSRLNLGVVKPYLIFGPKLDFELSKSTESNDTFAFYDDFKKTRTGFKVGLGSELNLIAFNFLLEFIYDYDLSNLYKNKYLKITSHSYDFRIGIYL